MNPWSLRLWVSTLTPSSFAPIRRKVTVTNSSDIYALGVCPRNVNRGSPRFPTRTLPEELFSVVCEQEPVLPSVAARIEAEPHFEVPCTQSSSVR